MTTGLLHAPGQLAASITPASASKYRLFFDITGGTPVPSIIDSAGTLYSFGGLSQVAIETALATHMTDTATIDVTAVAGSFVWDVKAASIVNAKLADMAQATIKGRASGAGTGVPVDLSAAQVSTILGLGALATVSTVTNALMSTMSNNTVKGNVSGSIATPSDITPTQLTASMVNDATLPTGTNLPGRITAVEKYRLSEWKSLAADGAADPTGVTDCTTAFQALLTAGGDIHVGIGVFQVGLPAGVPTSLNATVDNTRVIGVHPRNSIIRTGAAAADVFNVTGVACLFDNFRVIAGVAGGGGTPSTLRTSGYAFNLGSASNTAGIVNCDIIYMHSGIKSSGALQYVDNCNIREVSQNAISGAAVYVENTGDRYMRRITSDSGTNATGCAGIRVKEASSVVISDCNLIHCGTCVDLDPTSTKTIASVKGVNCFFDTSVNGLSVNGVAAAGSIYRSNFTACWFGTMSANGVLMNGVAAGTAQFDGISFSHCEMYQCTTAGINCPLGGGAWTADACKIAGNGIGINVTAGTNHFPRVRNCEIGPYGNFAANTTGIVVGAGAYKGLIIMQCMAGNNTTNLTLGAVTVGAAEAGWFRITDNVGINPRGAVTTPGVPVAGATVTNTTGFRVLVVAKEGATASAGVVINGVATTASLINEQLMIPLEPGGTIAFTTTTVGSWVWVGQ